MASRLMFAKVSCFLLLLAFFWYEQELHSAGIRFLRQDSISLQGGGGYLKLMAEMSQSFLSPSPKSPVFIMILGSTGRVGSTFVSQMLSNRTNTVLFFEPLAHIMRKPCFKDAKCRVKYVSDVFSCKFENDTETLIESHQIFRKYFNNATFTCFAEKKKSRETCQKEMKVRSTCLESSVRFMKLVRGRLDWFQGMLKNSDNFKLIYLIRDPRATINSIVHMGWSKNATFWCGDMEKDLNAYDILSSLYPSKIMKVSYEDICLNPNKEVSKINEFLFGTSSLPKSIIGHISSHTKGNINGTMTTNRESRKQYEGWRWSISNETLKIVESEPRCLRFINRLNHRIFFSMDQVRDSSIPLVNN